MKRDKKQVEEQKTSMNKETKGRKNQTHEYETMSQQQNRYGKGREHPSSDGGSVMGQGNNH